jgi:ABC-type sulfate transport system substrate-binding protein
MDERLEALDNSIAGRDTSAYIVTRWRGYWCEMATGNPNKVETVAPPRIIVRELRNPDSCFWIVFLLIVVAFLVGWAFLFNRTAPIRLVVYGFSTQEEVFTQGVFPAFEQAWEAEIGRDLTIEGVFGASGTLARQINGGAPADVALFSNAQHVTRLKTGSLVQSETQPVVIGFTPMVIVTRRGNPAGIIALGDLARPGLRLLHADPRSSGAGEWAILAAYGSALRDISSDDRVAAEAQIKAIGNNVRFLGPSAWATLNLFRLGAGDAMVTYEQDARLSREMGVALDIVVPPRTIVAQHVAVIVDDNVKTAEQPVVQAFVDFILCDAGQRILSRYYLRPADLEGTGFPGLVRPFTVEDLGGWSIAYSKLIESLWQAEIEPRLDLVPAPVLLDTGE